MAVARVACIARFVGLSMGHIRISQNMAFLGEPLDSDQYCANLGMPRGGEVIGTSPACEGACQDCGRERVCVEVNKAKGISDYGYGCWSGYKVLCCKPALTGSDRNADPDHVTVMNYNTFMLEVKFIGPVNWKPDMAIRSAAIADWFTTLRTAEVPDVVVLEEIFSSYAEKMLQRMCSHEWHKNSEYYGATFWSRGWLTKCDSNSHFEFATSAVNPANGANVYKVGGVVVLIKKGITVVRAVDEEYTHYAGSDGWARKGFWAVNFVKVDQPYWIFGTHTQAWSEDADIRLAQLQQMKKFVDNHTGVNDRVIFAGDFNTDTGGDGTPKGKHFNNETDSMLAALNATVGTLEPKGFWLPLDDALFASADNMRNHYINHLDFASGRQNYDWVLAHAGGEVPQKMRTQIVPVKSDHCFVSETKPGKSDDLSDHFGFFASLCYKSSGCVVEPVDGHRGSSQFFPSKSPDC